jgi:hypothetical protein
MDGTTQFGAFSGRVSIYDGMTGPGPGALSDRDRTAQCARLWKYGYKQNELSRGTLFHHGRDMGLAATIMMAT